VIEELLWLEVRELVNTCSAVKHVGWRGVVRVKAELVAERPLLEHSSWRGTKRVKIKLIAE
jgi:hypothetical protein